MMLLLTLITSALAYPYAPYYQPYILGAPMQTIPATPAATPPAAGGGMPAFPFPSLQNFLNMFFPGFASNPTQLFMLDSTLDGDIAEASKKYMQGDLSEAMDKIYDSGDLFPLMAYGRQMAGRTMGGAAAAGAGAPGATGAQSARGAAMNPLVWSMIDLQRPRQLSAPRKYIQPVVYPNGAVEYYPVSPVNARLQQ